MKTSRKQCMMYLSVLAMGLMFAAGCDKVQELVSDIKDKVTNSKKIGDYPNTPIGAFRKQLDACIEQDYNKAMSGMPTDEELQQLADTSAQLSELRAKKKKTIQAMMETFSGVNGENDHGSIHVWYEDDFKCDGVEELGNGYNVAIAKVSVTICERRNGEIRRDRASAEAIRINGRWIMW